MPDTSVAIVGYVAEPRPQEQYADDLFDIYLEEKGLDIADADEYELEKVRANFDKHVANTPAFNMLSAVHVLSSDVVGRTHSWQTFQTEQPCLLGPAVDDQLAGLPGEQLLLIGFRSKQLLRYVRSEVLEVHGRSIYAEADDRKIQASALDDWLGLKPPYSDRMLYVMLARYKALPDSRVFAEGSATYLAVAAAKLAIKCDIIPCNCVPAIEQLLDNLHELYKGYTKRNVC